MASAQEKLASALEELRALQASGARVFRSEDFSRTARERLLDAGFVQEVVKGWVVSRDPTAKPGDSTPWFSSFWEFCARYAEHRFGSDWCLAPQESLLLHAERTAVPKQVVLNSPTANNKRVDLVHGTSLFALKTALPVLNDQVTRSSLRLYTVDAALVRVTEAFFEKSPIEAQVILRGVAEPSGLLARLLDGGHTIVAGRLVGAFRHIGKNDIADEIASAMQSGGHQVRESDPFAENVPVTAAPRRGSAPFNERLRTLWESTRETVIQEFDVAPGAMDKRSSLAQIDDVYELDAYHSLSIEGYVVTTELIERVASGRWEPESSAGDRENKNALAARGYWQAFQLVRASIDRLLTDADLSLLRTAHREWYRELFAPSVAVGLLEASQLAGYRTQSIFLRGSRHLPPRAEVAREAVPALFDLIESEPEASVRAVLAHWLFGYVHPFPDGNGRVARFLMNALLVHGGYSWTVIRVEDRSDYLTSLETASADGDVGAFAAFVAKQVRFAQSNRSETKRPR